MARKTKESVQTWRALTQGVRPGLHAFVVGAQRSGTNMVMNILDRSYDTTVYHERDPRAFDEYLMRPPETIDNLIVRARAPVFVIKALCEMDRLPWLMERFAPARVIWVVRHYDDAVNSSLRSFGKVADQVSGLVDDPGFHVWMGKGMSRETHARLRELHYPEMNEASRVALFWYTRNRLLFDTGLADDPRVILVSYERLVTDPHVEFRDVFAFLGLDYGDRLAANVTPRSVRKAPAPDIDPEVRAACDALLVELGWSAAGLGLSQEPEAVAVS
ncbi:sulfotransferase family protein [Aquisalimonas sp. APHAB1-3]|uniref:sulfotransferase family protein n=1 Tax=Aquisalimonas sp. APHAB1-3 TaxID=3402080 RepID=UPI003AAB5759